MVELRFDWDPRKAAENLRKHRVSFEEAQTAFLDEEALVIEVIRIISARRADRHEQEQYRERLKR